MSKSLILDDFIDILVAKTSQPREDVEAFVKRYFDDLRNQLSQSGEAIAEGLGTFLSVEDRDGGATVKFIPLAEVRDAVNTPFALFDPVEVGPEFVLDDEPVEEEVVEKDEAESVADIAPAETAEEVAEEEEKPIPASTEPTEPAVPEPPVYIEPFEPEVASIPASEIAETESEMAAEETSQPKRRSSAFSWIAMALLAVLAYFAGLFTPREILFGDTVKEDESNLQTEQAEPSKAAAVQEPIDEVIIEADDPQIQAVGAQKELIDTVRVKYYITHMAKRYYGNDNFWSYIYKENEDKLGHPDLTQPGTVVVIPPAEKYGIDASNPESVKAAKQLGFEIYRKYSK